MGALDGTQTVVPVSEDPTISPMSSGAKGEAESRLRHAMTTSAPWRELGKKYWRAYGGNPFDPESLNYMEATERPAVKYNLAIGTINAVWGADMTEMKEPRFQGVDTDVFDNAVSDWVTRVVRHFRQRTGGHDHEETMFLDKLVTGVGCTRTWLSNRRFPFSIKQGHVDTWKMYWDPASKEPNLRDRRWQFYVDSWEVSDAVATWPKKAAEIRALGRSSQTQSTSRNYRVVHDNDYGPGSSAGEGSTLPNVSDFKVNVVEYQYIKSEPWVAFTDPTTGEDVQLPREEFYGNANKNVVGRLNEILATEDPEPDPSLIYELDQTTQEPIVNPLTGEPEQRLDEFGNPVKVYLYDSVDSIDFPKDVYRRAFFAQSTDSGPLVSLEDLPLPFERFTYTFDTGFVERSPSTGRSEFFGLMHVIFDPQKYAVKVLSSILEMLRRSSKGGWFIKANAIANLNTFADDMAKPAPIIMVAEDANLSEDIRDMGQAQWPAAFERFFDIVLDAVPEISGVTRAFKGTLTSERSNVLVSNLQTQSQTMLAPLYRPLTEARKELAVTMALFILKYIPESAINKIIGKQIVVGVTHEEDPATGEVAKDESGQPVPIMIEVDGQPVPITPAYILKNSVNLMEYDVEVDIGSASPTARQAFWRLWTDTAMLTELGKMGFPVQELFPSLMKYLPLPAEEAARLSKKAEAAMNKPAPQRIMEMMQQLPPEQVQEIYEALGGMVEGGAPPPEEMPQPEMMQAQG